MSHHFLLSTLAAKALFWAAAAACLLAHIAILRSVLRSKAGRGREIAWALLPALALAAVLAMTWRHIASRT